MHLTAERLDRVSPSQTIACTSTAMPHMPPTEAAMVCM